MVSDITQMRFAATLRVIDSMVECARAKVLVFLDDDGVVDILRSWCIVLNWRCVRFGRGGSTVAAGG